MGRHRGAASTSEHEYVHEDGHTHGEHRHGEARRAHAAARDAEVRDRFGGTNLGAAFFGWLVAIAMTVLLSGVVGAVATAVGSSAQVSQTEAEQEAGTIGLVAAVVLATVLLLAYYTGGYVAGRMSRFDGARQGLAVWLIGLLVTALAVGVGLLFGSQYNVLDRVNLPQVPIPTEQLNMGGIITALVIVVGTALAAIAGGKVGHHYHAKVDKVAWR
ncbi:MAG TPA: hypothetical protein VFR87_14580 [Nocardioidaceae bacterium]|nr:hypothetical protein [Nocardioidaceae bacterium]